MKNVITIVFVGIGLFLGALLLGVVMAKFGLGLPWLLVCAVLYAFFGYLVICRFQKKLSFRRLSFRRLAVVLLIPLFLACSGCAGLGVWSSTAQADITAFVAWANQYIGGVLQAAPAVIAEAGQLLGANSKVVTDANAAVGAAGTALTALNTAAQSAQSTNTEQSNVQAAIQAVNTTVGAVQAAVAQAKAAPAPTTAPVVTPAK
jgi:hypothetical protein